MRRIDPGSFSALMMAVLATLKGWVFFHLLFLVTFTRCFIPEYEAVLNKIDSERASALTQEHAARDVLARLLPDHVSSFELRIITKVHFAVFGSLAHIFELPQSSQYDYSYIQYDDYMHFPV